jgi:dolichol kinase
MSIPRPLERFQGAGEWNSFYFLTLRTSEIHLFYNLQLFYWHFLEILWLFIFLIFYNFSMKRNVNECHGVTILVQHLFDSHRQTDRKKREIGCQTSWLVSFTVWSGKKTVNDSVLPAGQLVTEFQS